MKRFPALTLAAVAWATSTSGAATPALPRAFTWDQIMASPLQPNGLSRHVLREPTATTDQLQFHITTLPPGKSSHAPHRHPNEEIIIIKEGTVEALVDGVERRLGPGSFIFQASNHLHGIKNVGDTPATYYVINWHSPGMLAKPTPQ